MTKPSLAHLAPLVGLLFFAAVLGVLHHELAAYHYQDVIQQVSELPLGRVALAIALTVLSYLILTGYDWMALRFVQHPLPYGRVALASFIGYAVSHNIGFALLSGTSVRYRLYSAWGLSAVEVAKVMAFIGLTFWLGFLTLGGLVFLVEPVSIPNLLRLPIDSVQPLGAAFLVLVAAYLVFTIRRPAPLKIRGWEWSLPAPRFSAAQLVISSLDWAVAGSVLYTLLPHEATGSYPAFLAMFLLAQLSGVVSQVPGGLGVFETVIVLFLSPAVPAPSILASLVAYRGIYYLLPLGIAVILLGGREVLERREGVVRAARVFGPWVQPLVPNVLAFGAFFGGAVLLVSGATPAVGSRLAWLNNLVPLPVLEVSHFLGSLTGAGLLLLARGVQQRLDAAYFLTAGLLAAGVVFSLLKGLDYEEAVVLGLLLAALLPCRRYFYRKASLIGERLTPAWTAAVALVLLSAAWLGIFSYKHVEYSNDLWWHFSLAGEAPRYLRATVGAIGLSLVVAVARLLRPAPPEPVRPSAAELSRAQTVVTASPETMANLALLGDKTLLFNEEGTAFVMYGVEGRSWVALGDPVGPEAELPGLAWRFRELCDRHGGWTVFYQVDHHRLSLYLDLGLTLLKLGEEARVPLPAFSLDGASRKGLRYTRRRLEKEGCVFEIIPPDRVASLLPELSALSDRWLESKQTREKGFSLGYLDPVYIQRFPLGVVRQAGTMIAFANIWRSAQHEELAVDLMRYSHEAPGGVMDYLFVELMLWGQREGYQCFNLGMAPLSGLENRALAPLWARVGGFVFRHGEHFYNFQGLREYKGKFDPQWEPKYLASPGGLYLPRILTDIAALISGGFKGVIAK